MHIYRAWNDNQALKALCDGVTWSGVGYDKGEAIKKELTPGPLCRQVLQEVFRILPFQMNPASTEQGPTTRERGRPHGYQEMDASFRQILPIPFQTPAHGKSRCSKLFRPWRS